MSGLARHFFIGDTDPSTDTGSAQYWLYEIAEESNAANYPYISVGRTGPIKNLTRDDAFGSIDWSLGAPKGAWPNLASHPDFAIWFAPATNIQNIPGETTTGLRDTTTFDALLKLIDQSRDVAPHAPVVIVENWASIDPFLLNGELTDTTRTLYLEFVQGAYHDWFQTLVDNLQTARPDTTITLLPTASTLSALMSDAFSGQADLFLPPTPEEGIEAREFLAGALEYSYVFQTPLPAQSHVATQAVPDLGGDYATLAAAISQSILGPQPIDPNLILIQGTAEDDVTIFNAQASEIDLGDGLDTLVFSGDRAETNLIFGAEGQLFIQAPGDKDPVEAENVERLSFTDGTLAFDDDGTAGQVYRLYQAAFNRTPDSEGLGFWIKEMDEARITLKQAAEFFMTSEEFALAYGTADEVTDALFLTLLYVNTLDRVPDNEGFIYWRDQQNDSVSRADMMVYFSESAENTARVAPAIEDGIWYF